MIKNNHLLATGANNEEAFMTISLKTDSRCQLELILLNKMTG